MGQSSTPVAVAPRRRDPLASLGTTTEQLLCRFTGYGTPFLAVDQAVVESNIDVVLGITQGRWRPHVKTVKSSWGMQRLLDAGLSHFKASTVEEVECLLTLGAGDVLLAMPAVGETQHRMAHLAAKFPDQNVSVLVDEPAALASWHDAALGVFLDVDTGMHRTGLDVECVADAAELLSTCTSRGYRFAGVHHYDGHLAGLDEPRRTELTHRGLSALNQLTVELARAGYRPPEVVTGGSHTFWPALQHDFAPEVADVLRVSPGTVVYCDVRSLERLGDVGLRPAVAVVASVISAPTPGSVTVDAGLTAIQTDAGRPHAALSGALSATVGEPAQAHLALEFTDPSEAPPVGSRVCLVPRHVDTAVCQFDEFVVTHDGAVSVHPIDARHHRVLEHHG